MSRGFLIAALLLVGCGPPLHPQFEGREDARWIAFDLDLSPDVHTPDVVRGLEQKARVHGCRTDRLSEGGFHNRRAYGITVYCRDDADSLTVIAVIARRTALTIGCERPTAYEQCLALFRRILLAK